MNAPERGILPDIQSRIDRRGIPIDEVGVRGVRYPVTLLARGWTVPTIADISMNVALRAAEKGTHMSRFVEILEAHATPLDNHGFRAMVLAMCERLEARAGSIEMRFPFFVRKAAPVTRASSLMDYLVKWRGAVTVTGAYSFRMRVEVPATSLCPCSKEISEYGAHNQRSHIAIDAEIAGDVRIEELIAMAEASASCEVYGLLKRADEKYVTEVAYDNPKFVEDLVRDVARALDRDPRIPSYSVEAENFESIHNHSAFARLARRSGKPWDGAS